jgi:hypothetical protein
MIGLIGPSLKMPMQLTPTSIYELSWSGGLFLHSVVLGNYGMSTEYFQYSAFNEYWFVPKNVMLNQIFPSGPQAVRVTLLHKKSPPDSQCSTLASYVALGDDFQFQSSSLYSPGQIPNGSWTPGIPSGMAQNPVFAAPGQDPKRIRLMIVPSSNGGLAKLIWFVQDPNGSPYFSGSADGAYADLTRIDPGQSGYPTTNGWYYIIDQPPDIVASKPKARAAKASKRGR